MALRQLAEALLPALVRQAVGLPAAQWWQHGAWAGARSVSSRSAPAAASSSKRGMSKHRSPGPPKRRGFAISEAKRLAGGQDG